MIQEVRVANYVAGLKITLPPIAQKYFASDRMSLQVAEDGKTVTVVGDEEGVLVHPIKNSPNKIVTFGMKGRPKLPLFGATPLSAVETTHKGAPALKIKLNGHFNSYNARSKKAKNKIRAAAQKIKRAAAKTSLASTHVPIQAISLAQAVETINRYKAEFGDSMEIEISQTGIKAAIIVG